MTKELKLFGDKGMLISGNKRKYNFFIDRYKSAYKLQLEDLYNLVKKKKNQEHHLMMAKTLSFWPMLLINL